ncbi:MAG TPA: S53 family peptidase [Candidatus Eremiobacteraceae bacterium]
MSRAMRFLAMGAGVIVAFISAACTGDSNAIPGFGSGGGPLQHGSRIFPGAAAAVCGVVGPGFARCHAIRRTDIGTVSAVGQDFGASPDRHHRPSPTPKPSPTPTPSASPSPSPPPSPSPSPSAAPSPSPSPSSGNCPVLSISGYQPCDLQTAYSLPSSTGGSGETVGIVDAFDDPTAESDLATYRSAFGLSACTTANGCFRKVNESGVQGNYPANNTGWAQEISLDLDMASAICPNCHILLVEGTTNSFADLATSENTAVSLGANVVSNSYGGSESSGIISTYGPNYNHAGVTITASTGDSGFSPTAQFPADLTSVAAIGGTSLLSTSPRSETAWSGAGSGCSGIVAQPSWQSTISNITSVCARRAYADVSAVADPNTGVAVYDTDGASGWLVFGGTSVASPIVASVYALAGNPGSTGPSYPYAHTGSLNDVTSGSNGGCGTDLCNARSGWDGPTGLGSPNGTGAF